MNGIKVLTRVMVAMGMAVAAVAEEPIRRVVINIPAMQLHLYEGDKLVKSYRVAVGKRSTPTPTGSFQIASKVDHPTWYGPGQVVKASPVNPVGTRWIGLDKKGYGIHGTNAPRSIGRAASHGCVRMQNREVEDLFTRVQVGDKVTIVYQTKAEDGTALGDVYGRENASGQN